MVRQHHKGGDRRGLDLKINVKKVDISVDSIVFCITEINIVTLNEVEFQFQYLTTEEGI